MGMSKNTALLYWGGGGGGGDNPADIYFIN